MSELILHRIRVWDLPTRLYHWFQMILFFACWWTASEDDMQWHFRFAFMLMTLVIFRILWGIIGSYHSRFSSFLLSPVTAIKQMNKKAIGHNAAGGWFAVAMIFLLVMQLVSGLFTDDEVFTTGPLAMYASSEVVSWFSWWHPINYDLLLITVTIHITVVLAHLIEKDDLLLPMLHGYKWHSIKMNWHSTSPFVALALVIGVYAILYYFTWDL